RTGSGQSPSSSHKTLLLFISLVLDLQDGEERLLGDLDIADLLHALLAGLLSFEKFLLARDVAAIAFRKHILAQGLDVLAGDDLGAYGCLDGDVEHLARYQPAHLGHDLARTNAGACPVRDHGERVDAIAVD